MNQTFEHPLTVSPDDIDSLKHVNNVVYLRWLLEAVDAHCLHLGYTIPAWAAAGAAFVVRRHALEYLAPAYEGEQLVVRTWLSTLDARTSMRQYDLYRPSDQRLLLKAHTLAVYIDLKTGIPKRIPEDIDSAFRRYLHLPAA